MTRLRTVPRAARSIDGRVASPAPHCFPAASGASTVLIVLSRARAVDWVVGMMVTVLLAGVLML